MKALHCLALLLALFFAGCSKPVPPLGSGVDPSVKGEWKSERNYANDHFKFALAIPADWELQKGDEESLKFMFQLLEKAPGGERAIEEFRKKSVKSHAPLRAVAQSEQVAPERKSNVLVTIESLEGKTAVNTGEDFLKSAEETMKSIPGGPQFDGPATQATVNGISFWTRTSTLKVNGGEGVLWSGAGGYAIHQRGYATVKGGYGLMILCTWTTSGEDPTEKFIREGLTALK